jgi:hypothetical protein
MVGFLQKVSEIVRFLEFVACWVQHWRNGSTRLCWASLRGAMRYQTFGPIGKGKRSLGSEKPLDAVDIMIA